MRYPTSPSSTTSIRECRSPDGDSSLNRTCSIDSLVKNSHARSRSLLSWSPTMSRYCSDWTKKRMNRALKLTNWCKWSSSACKVKKHLRLSSQRFSTFCARIRLICRTDRSSNQRKHSNRSKRIQWHTSVPFHSNYKSLLASRRLSSRTSIV